MNRLSANEYEQVVQWVEGIVPTLRNYAYAFPRLFCYEDLYQDAFLMAVDLYAKIADKRYPVAYLRACIYHHLNRYAKIVREHAMISLETPCEGTDGIPLSEAIEDRPSVRKDEDRAELQEQALYEALRRLPLEAQNHLRRCYDLNSFEPVPLFPYVLNRQFSCMNVCQTYAYRHLRNDTILAKQLYG